MQGQNIAPKVTCGGCKNGSPFSGIAWMCSGPKSAFRSWNLAQEQELLCSFHCAEINLKGGVCGGMGHIFRDSEDVPTNNSLGGTALWEYHLSILMSLPVLSLHECKWRPDMRWWKLVSDVLKNSVCSAESTTKTVLCFQVFSKRSWDVSPQSSVLQVLVVVGRSWWSSSDLALCPTVVKDSLRAGTLLCQGSFALTGLFFIPPYKSLFSLIQLLEKDYSLRIKSSRN